MSKHEPMSVPSMMSEFLRDVAVLVLVFFPLDFALSRNNLSIGLMIGTGVVSLICLVTGMALELLGA